MLFDYFLKETQFLVQLELTILGAEWMELSETFEEFSSIMGLSKKKKTSFLPFKLIGVTLADIFTIVSKQVENGLENAGHLDNSVLSKSQNRFFPLVCW
jgi:hypothetical protein